MAIREFTGDLDDADGAGNVGMVREFDGDLDAPKAAGRFDDLMARQQEYDDTHSIGDKVGMGLTAGMESLRASKAMGSAVDAAEDYASFQESEPGLLSAKPAGWRKPAKSAISARPGEPVDPMTGSPLVSFGGDPSSLGGEAVAEAFKRRKERLESAIARNIKHTGKSSAIPMSPVAEAAMKAETFGEAWDIAKQDPVAFIMDTGVRSAPFMVEPIVTGVVGASLGGVPGFMVATGLGSAHVDYAAELGEALQRQGVDTTNPEAVKAALLNNGVLSNIKSDARTHAAFVGLFDGLTAGLASKTLAPKAVSQPLAREFVNLVNQFGAQAAGGMAGEASGQYASTGAIHSPGEVLAEGAGEMITAPAEIITATATGLRDTKDPSLVADGTLGAEDIAADMERPTNTGDQLRDSVNDLLNEADSKATEIPATQPLDPFAERIAAQGEERQAQIDATMPQEAGPRFQVSPEMRAQTPQAGRDSWTPVAEKQVGAPEQKPFDITERESGGILVKGDKQAIRKKLADAGVKITGMGSKEGVVFGRGQAQAVRDALALPEKTLDEAAHEAATSPMNDLKEPTEAQKEAGNYKKGSYRLHGLDLAIENPRGSRRTGTSPDGTKWENTLQHHYGYVKGTTGRDGDAVDVFLTENAEDQSRPVFVVDQVDPETRRFDEHKAVIGASTEQEARDAYLANYDAGWNGIGGVTQMSVGEFKDWAKSGDTTKRLTAKNEEAAQTAEAGPEGELVEQGAPVTIEPFSDKSILIKGDKDAIRAKLAEAGISKGLWNTKHGGLVLPKKYEAAAGKALRAKPERRKHDVLRDDIAAIADPQERAKAVEELRRMALTDHRTGLASGAALEQHLRMLDKAGKPYRLASLDVVGLKWVNDNMNPSVGDELIARVGEILERANGEYGLFLASPKGDEFYAVVEGNSDAAVREMVRKAQDIGNQAVLTYTLGDGTVIEKHGIDLYAGYGKSQEAADADLNNAKDKAKSATKAERQAQGITDDRLAEPRGVVRRAAEGRNAESNAPAEEVAFTNATPLQATADRAPGERTGARDAQDVAPRTQKPKAADAAPESGPEGGLAEPAAQGQGESLQVDEKAATKILNAANVTGKDRLDIMRDFRDGKYSLKDLEEAYPASDQVRAATNLIQEDQESQPASQAKIEDFGETIAGARKGTWQTYAKKMQDAGGEDITSVPFAKSWPEPDYQKMIDEGADPWTVAFIRAARDEVPTKPRAGWKLRSWANQVEALRSLVMSALDRPEFAAKIKEELPSNKALEPWAGRVELYTEIGHNLSLKGVTFRKHHYALYEGEKNVDRWTVERPAKASSFSNWPQEMAAGKTHDEALANFKRAVASGEFDKTSSKRQTTFDIYSDRAGEKKGKWVVGKKVGKDYVDLETFDTVKEAREYRDNNQTKLEEKLARFKDIPAHRKESNSPRVGVDHRNGADVTPEQFQDAFGFRGVQFGNYVEQGKRQQDLNEAYDALMDLAGILNVPAKALSLNGELGLAFGARGKGAAGKGKGAVAAAAHYESGEIVINLTKKSGAGSLAHEWFHSLDNYFSRARNEKGEFVSERAYERGEGVRPEVIEAFQQIVQAINGTKLKQRAAILDKARSKAYWSTGREMFARAFESYVIEKLKDQNQSNDYLANIVGEDYWNAAAALGLEKEGSYPYPEAAEIQAIRAAFDNFFRVVETKETDKGVAMFARAYHGTPHRFDRFSLDAIGTGEGAQAYGWGLYFAGKREVAEWYKSNLTYTKTKDSFLDALPEDAGFGEVMDLVGTGHFTPYQDRVLRALDKDDWLGFDYPAQAISAAYRNLDNYDPSQELSDAVSGSGALYQVDIPDNSELLDWDKPLREQPEGVRDALSRMRPDEDGLYESFDPSRIVYDADMRGSEIYRRIKIAEGGAEAASKYLNSIGIPGLRYLDGTSRNDGEGSHNYVIWDENAVTVEAVNDEMRQAASFGRAITEESLYRGTKKTKGMTADSVREAISRIILTWGENGPKVEVVQSESDLPAHIRKQIGPGGMVQGVNDPASGAIYLVARELDNRKDALRILAHEAVGHYGMEEMLGEAFTGVVERLQWLKRAGNRKILDISKRVKDAYPGIDENTEAREIIAALAEERKFGGPVKDLMAKVYAAMRAFLRKLGFNVIWSTPELNAMLARAARRLREDGGRRQTIPEALEHPQLGDIDVAIGKGRTGASRFVAESPEIAANIEDLVANATVARRDAETATLENNGVTFDLIKKNGRWTLTDAVNFSRSGDTLMGMTDKSGTGDSLTESSPVTPESEAPHIVVARQMLSAMGDDPHADYGVRVIPGEYEGEIFAGDNLPNSRKWIDGTETETELDGVSAAGIRRSDLDSVLQAIKNVGAHGEPGRNGFYFGDRVALVKGSRIGYGEDSGEVLLSDPEVVGIWRKPSKGNSEVLPNPNQPQRTQGAAANFARKRDGGDAFKEENDRIREQDRTLWDKSNTFLKRQLSPGGLLPESVFDAKIARDSQFEVVEFDSQHLIGQLERAVKADYGKAFGSLDEETINTLNEALTGKVDDAIPERTKKTIVAMRQYIDVLSNKYVDILERQANELVAKANETGSDADKAAAIAKLQLMETITSNQGKYAHRSYRAFDDPKWPKKVPDKVLNDARDYLVNRHIEKGEAQEEARRLAEVAIHEILKNGTAYDSMEGMIRESKLGAKDLSVLKKRKEIAPEIRALLGEYKDARLNFVKSTTKMGRLIWNETFLERVRDAGMGVFLFEGTNRPPQATKQIAGDAAETYSPLNGLWTFPETEQAFKDALGKEQMANWYRTIVQINGMVKFGKTVLAPTTAMRNWQSAMLFAVANGHFDMRHMSKSLTALREYFTHQGKGEKLRYLRKLKQLGVVYDTPYAGEMMRLLDDSNIENKILSGKGQMAMREMLGYAQKFYQFGDDFWKIIGFENEKRLLMEKAGMTEAQAEKEAAERIRNTYPTYSMVGRGVQSLRRFPLAGTFVSFPAEIIRTTGNMFRYVAKDMKDPKMRPIAMRRAAGLAIASGFAYGLQALSMAFFGVDDDEDEAVRLLAAKWNKNSNLVYQGRDESGKLRYFDISFLDPYNYFKRPITAVTRDQPWEEKASDVAAELLTPFLGTDITAGAVFEVLANKKEGSGAPVYQDHDMPAEQAKDIADHLRKRLQPGLMANVERTMKAVRGDVTKSGKKYDLGDEIVAWLGWRASTIDPKVSLYYRSFEFSDAKSEANKKLNDVLQDPNEVTDKELEAAYSLSLKVREKAYHDMYLIVQAAMASGMSGSEIHRTLTQSGISGDDARMIMRGDVPEWRPTTESVRRMKDKARTLLGKEKAMKIHERAMKLRGISKNRSDTQAGQ